MDNRSIRVISEGKDDLLSAINIVNKHYNGAVGYAIVEVVEDTTHPTTRGTYIRAKVMDAEKNRRPCIIFYWSVPTNVPEFQKFPFNHTSEDMANFAHRWLNSLSGHYYSDDIDGDVGKGFEAFTCSWGYVLGGWEAIIGVLPVPALYGK